MLATALSSRSFVVTAELGPPRDPDPELVRARRPRAGRVGRRGQRDRQPGGDGQALPRRVLGAAHRRGRRPDPPDHRPRPQRHGPAVRAAGAWALGVRTVLTLTGDPLKVGPYEAIATGVGDLDSLGLARLIAKHERGPARGRRAAGAADRRSSSPAPPTRWSTRSSALEGKLAAGVGLLQTNIVYDVERFAAWLAPFVEAGITERAPLLVGIAPPRSSRMLTYMHERIPGVEVDDATFARMEGRSGDAATATGIEIAAELIERVREVPGVERRAPDGARVGDRRGAGGRPRGGARDARRELAVHRLGLAREPAKARELSAPRRRCPSPDRAERRRARGRRFLALADAPRDLGEVAPGVRAEQEHLGRVRQLDRRARLAQRVLGVPLAGRELASGRVALDDPLGVVRRGAPPRCRRPRPPRPPSRPRRAARARGRPGSSTGTSGRRSRARRARLARAWPRAAAGSPASISAYASNVAIQMEACCSPRSARPARDRASCASAVSKSPSMASSTAAKPRTPSSA